MRLLIIVDMALAAISVLLIAIGLGRNGLGLLIVTGLGSDVPVLLIMALLFTVPGFYILLGALLLFQRITLDHQHKSKRRAPSELGVGQS